MKPAAEIYHVTIHGRTLESRDLKLLLARAVSEKRSMDQKFRTFIGMHHRRPMESAGLDISL